MTGRELIIYIMQNGLEDKVIFETISEGEAAVKFGVGIATIRLWYKLELIDGFELNNTLLISKKAMDPRKRDEHE